MRKITLAALVVLAFPFAATTSLAQSPAQPRSANPSNTAFASCVEKPAGNGLRFECATPAFLPDESDDEDADPSASGVRIILRLPEGTALRIAIDQRTRIAQVGEIVQGHVVESVYAFDEPAGTLVRGHVTHIAAVPKLRRAQS